MCFVAVHLKPNTCSYLENLNVYLIFPIYFSVSKDLRVNFILYIQLCIWQTLINPNEENLIVDLPPLTNRRDDMNKFILFNAFSCVQFHLKIISHYKITD